MGLGGRLYLVYLAANSSSGSKSPPGNQSFVLWISTPISTSHAGPRSGGSAHRSRSSGVPHRGAPPGNPEVGGGRAPTARPRPRRSRPSPRQRRLEKLGDMLGAVGLQVTGNGESLGFPHQPGHQGGRRCSALRLTPLAFIGRAGRNRHRRKLVSSAQQSRNPARSARHRPRRGAPRTPNEAGRQGAPIRSLARPCVQASGQPGPPPGRWASCPDRGPRPPVCRVSRCASAVAASSSGLPAGLRRQGPALFHMAAHGPGAGAACCRPRFAPLPLTCSVKALGVLLLVGRPGAAAMVCRSHWRVALPGEGRLSRLGMGIFKVGA